jgi:hypothetical protein
MEMSTCFLALFHLMDRPQQSVPARSTEILQWPTSEVKVFCTKIVNTEAKFCRTSVVLPETRGAGARVAAAPRKLSDKVLAGKNCSLFQSMHSFFDSDANATIRADETIEIALFADGLGETFVFDPHEFVVLHRRSKKMIF